MPGCRQERVHAEKVGSDSGRDRKSPNFHLDSPDVRAYEGLWFGWRGFGIFREDLEISSPLIYRVTYFVTATLTSAAISDKRLFLAAAEAGPVPGRESSCLNSSITLSRLWASTLDI